MSHRINSTGRKRLLRENVSIRLIEGKSGGAPSFNAVISIPGELNLDSSARVYIEPYVRRSSMRFDFGTVGNIVVPNDLALSGIDAGTPILFDVKVVDESGQVGRILAAAHALRPEGDEDGIGRDSILPLRSMDLGQRVWKLEVDKDAGPTLCINNRIPDLKSWLMSDVRYMGMIYPEVVRRMVVECWSEHSGADDNAHWVVAWRTWIQSRLGREPREDEISSDGIDMLAEDVVDRFAEMHRYASLLGELAEDR